MFKTGYVESVILCYNVKLCGRDMNDCELRAWHEYVENSWDLTMWTTYEIMLLVYELIMSMVIKHDVLKYKYYMMMDEIL